MIKTPNRVNQDVLHKAISSGNDDRGQYQNLLLKHANDWLSVKSNVLTEEIDLAASNAYEITQLLWKMYHRRQDSVSIKLKKKTASVSKTKRHRRKEKKGTEKNRKEISPLEHTLSIGERGSSTRVGNTSMSSTSPAISSKLVDDSCQTAERQKNNTEKNRSELENTAAAHEDPNTLMDESPQIINHLPFPIGENTGTRYDESAKDDEDSLEEGEIRDSPSGSPAGQGVTHTDLADVSDLVSDISSSEGEQDMLNIRAAGSNRLVFPSVTTYHQPQPALSNDYQDYYVQNYLTQIPAYSVGTAPAPMGQHQAMAQHQHHTAGQHQPVVTIEVSDEEPIHEERPNDECSNAYESIINPNSDDGSEDDTYSQCHGRTQPLKLSAEQEKRKERVYKYRGKDALCLKNAEGSLISWPTGIARSGPDKLWKWWRTHIEMNNGSLVLCLPGIDHIHGTIPSLSAKKGAHIAVPKIVDDMHQFLKSLDETKFPNFGSHLTVTANDTRRNANQKSVKVKKLLPMAEELSQGSVKRINFEISKKKTSFLTANNRITIREFASIRNLTAMTSKKSERDISNQPQASSSSDFYSYGEPVNGSSVSSYARTHGSSFGYLTTASKTDLEQYDAKSSTALSKDEASVESRSNKSYSQSNKNKKEQKHHSRENVLLRCRVRSSSSSDQSLHRERRPSERNRHTDRSSTDRSRYGDKSPSDRYRHRDHSPSSDRSRSQDSSLQSWESPHRR